MTKTCRNVGGFGLVEIMVGLVIGMIATIVMFQTFALAERHKRLVTGAADAQSNGAIAAYTIERDIKMAGWGLRFDSFSDCQTFYTYSAARQKAIDDLATPGASLLAAVIITDGGDAPDSVAIQYYQSPQNTNLNFTSTQLAKSLPAVSSALTVRNQDGCEAGNLAVLAQGGQCMLVQVSAAGAEGELQYSSGGKYNFNPPTAYQQANNWPAFSCGTGGGAKPLDCPLDPRTATTVQCFGGLWQRNYSVSANHQLQLAESGGGNPGVTSTVSPDIIDMQARYGIADDVATPQKVTKWVAATGEWAPASLTPGKIRQIKALRIALLARSTTYEKPDAEGRCTTTDAASIAAWPQWDGQTVFAQANLPADFACYRYKTFAIDIPMRNLIWAQN